MGETDDLPPELLTTRVRGILWKEYGERLPGFDGDDAINALILHGLEAKRTEYENRKNNRPSQGNYN